MSLSPKDAVFSALFRNCLFRSDSRVSVHEHVAHELADHLLHWRRGLADAALFKGQLRQLRIYVLRYGAEVEVVPRPFDGFSLVHTSLAGGTEVESDGQRLHVGEGRTAVLSPRQRVLLRWHPGAVQLILRVPHTLIREAAGCREDDALALAPGVLVAREHSSQWDLIAQSLLNALSLPGEAPAHASWLDHFERNVALFLLAQQPSQFAVPREPERAIVLPEPVDQALRSGHRKRMEALLAFMEQRLCAPISLGDLARVAGVSVRTLNVLCHHHHGVSPMELLRNTRLDAARSRLLLSPDDSISETALTFGFGHLGRFAGYYSARFGERPRDTQTRGKGLAGPAAAPRPLPPFD